MTLPCSNISGIITVDKPAGWTSHDVVSKLRRITGQKRVGHGGTLDPMATGVLPVFAGRATKAAEFCESFDKEYIAGVRFGIVTDTQDITGTVTGGTGQAAVTAVELETVLPHFLGRQKQIPPMYSAIKQNGKKLYELARRGAEVPRSARDITIYSVEITDGPQNEDTSFYLRVACSKGTYIRTLCHDIGALLGCGAAMSYLRRTKAGVFTIEKAHTLDAVIDAFTTGEAIEDILFPADSIFSQYPSICLDENSTRKAKNGALHILDGTADGRYRFYAPGGEFLMLGEINGNRVKIIKNFFGG